MDLLHRPALRTTQSAANGIAGGRHGRRDHIARRGPVVLHRRHQPRDVPLHADEPHVPRPRAGAGHVTPAGSHPPGRQPLAPAATARVFLNNCIGCHTGMDPMAQAFAYYTYDDTAGPHRLYPRARCSRSTSTTTTPSRSASSRRTTLGEPLARGPQRAARLGSGSAAGLRHGREVAGRGTRQQRRVRARCQVEKVFRRRSASAPQDEHGSRTKSSGSKIASSAASNLQRLKRVFAEAAVVLHGRLRDEGHEPRTFQTFASVTRDRSVDDRQLAIGRTGCVRGSCPVGAAGGGAPTTENPNTTAANPPPSYNGPAPANGRRAGVQAEHSGTTSRRAIAAAQCHNAGGQAPMFRAQR